MNSAKGTKTINSHQPKRDGVGCLKKGKMGIVTIIKPLLSKKQMLERLQFSKNLQVAIKANELITGELSEDNIFGGFLTAVLKADYNDALKRADDHNRIAMEARDFSVCKFMFIAKDKLGYLSGEEYWLKLRTIGGQVEVTPPVNSDCIILSYPNFMFFSYEWQVI